MAVVSTFGAVAARSFATCSGLPISSHFAATPRSASSRITNQARAFSFSGSTDPLSSGKSGLSVLRSFWLGALSFTQIASSVKNGDAQDGLSVTVFAPANQLTISMMHRPLRGSPPPLPLIKFTFAIFIQSITSFSR
jgi:hypothetical protein